MFIIDNEEMKPQKYSGSIVLKKIRLLRLMENEKAIFLSNVSDNNKWFAFGRVALIMELLKNEDDKIIASKLLDTYQVHQHLIPNSFVCFWLNIEKEI